MIVDKKGFIHHVYFWLKSPGNQVDRDTLVDGLSKLSKIPTIRDFHIGKPAVTHRDVIDSTYAVSWLVLFASKEDQDIYQSDPIHLKFIEDCSKVWSKVVVYDTVGEE